MMTKSNAYWKRRAARNEARSGERSISLIARLLRQYELAKAELRREVNDFYARYAAKDGISYSDAVKRLGNAELTEWRYELEKYVEDINAETNPEVRRRLVSELNARSYGSRITRLAALEGQINIITSSLFSEGVKKAKATFGDAFTEGYFRTSYDLQCRSGFAREIAGIDEKLIEEVLSYRYNGQDFSSRIWDNKVALAANLKNTLTDSLIRGKSAAETASALAKVTDVSFRSAARLVRTETNRFHNEGAMRAYSEAGIEYYEFVATYDARTCEECAALDGKRFKLSEKEPGVNFPPIHPNDRCTTVAYDSDWDDGKAVEKLCGGYEEWKFKKEEENGIGWVDKERNKEYNKTADRKQYEAYKNRLGDYVPNTFGEFQRLKYDTPEKYKELSAFYTYKGRVPEATAADFKAYKAVKATGIFGSVRVPPKHINTEGLVFNDNHGLRHGCTLEQAIDYIDTAKCSVTRKRWNGYHTGYFSKDGATYVADEIHKIKTAFSKEDFDPITRAAMEVFE